MIRFALPLAALLLPATALAAPPVVPSPGEVVISEFLPLPAADRFVELRGEPEASLAGYLLLGYKDDTAGAVCELRMELALGDHALDAEGRFVISVAGGQYADQADLVHGQVGNLQGGPFIIALGYDDGGEAPFLLESHTYGGAMPACEAVDISVGPNWPRPSSGDSLTRCDDPDEAGVFAYITCGTPAPGADSPCACPVALTCELPEVVPIISALQPLPVSARYIEIMGAPGTPLDCFTVLGWRDATGGAACDERLRIPLTGATLPASGRLVIAPPNGDRAAEADLLHSHAGNLQGGPFALGLLFDEDTLLETFSWGGSQPACEAEGYGAVIQADRPASGHSLQRCEEEGLTYETCDTPTPGQEPACACPVPCGPMPEASARARITELQGLPSAQRFIELQGEPGMDLSCYTLLGFKESTDLTTCDQRLRIDLLGVTMPASGYLMIASPSGDRAAEADLLHTGAGSLQGGPFGLALLWDDDQLIEGFGWGGAMPVCAEWETTAAAAASAPSGGSFIRCDLPLNGDIESSLQTCGEPSPGAPTACLCPEPCQASDSHPRLNEIQATPAAERFIELRAQPGAHLGCYEIIGYRDRAVDGDDPICEEHLRMSLLGAFVPESGYLVVAAPTGAWADTADFLHPEAGRLQAGGGSSPYGLAVLWDGQLLVDSVSYGQAMPVCTGEGLGVGDPAPSLGTGRSLTRCEGVDHGDNAQDFRACSTPAPGAESPCCVDGPGAPGARRSGGCHGAPAIPWGAPLLFFGLAWLTLRRRASRRSDGRSAAASSE